MNLSHVARNLVSAALLSSLVVGCSAGDSTEGVAESAENAWWTPNAELNKEYPFPDEAKITAELERVITSAMESNRVNGKLQRGFHAKGNACLSGELSVEPGLPPEYAQGVFDQPARKSPVYARFSNGPGETQRDSVSAPRGVAFKVTEPARPERTQVFTGVNSPRFPTRNVAEFLDFVKAQQGGTAQSLGFMATHPNTALILAKHLDTNFTSFVGPTFWSGGAVRMGARASKYSFRPCKGQSTGKVAPNAPDGFLTSDLRSHLEKDGNVCFDMYVQLQRDPFRQPVEDASVEWKESEAPSKKVATLVFPKQDFSTPESAARCDKEIFSPWISIPAHQPIGNIMRARKTIYSASAAKRLQK